MGKHKDKSLEANDALAALMQHRTRTEAAASLGINRSTLWRRQQSPEYQAVLEQVQRAQLELIRKLAESAPTALQTLVNLTVDPNVSASLRSANSIYLVNQLLKLGTGVIEPAATEPSVPETAPEVPDELDAAPERPPLLTGGHKYTSKEAIEAVLDSEGGTNLAEKEMLFKALTLAMKQKKADSDPSETASPEPSSATTGPANPASVHANKPESGPKPSPPNPIKVTMRYAWEEENSAKSRAAEPTPGSSGPGAIRRHWDD